MRNQPSTQIRIPSRAAAVVAGVVALSAQGAMAQTNLVTNGTFAITGCSGTCKSFQFGTYGGYTPTETLAGWTTTSYSFAFLPTSTVATGVYGSLSLYSQTTSPANSFTNASPTGGNFIAEDSDYGTTAITQQISGLTIGGSYKLTFSWGGDEQTGFNSVTTDAWQVSLGSSTQTTNTITVPAQGFLGWYTTTMYFVATAASEQLAFLAVGGPSGSVPPFALLSNVSLVSAPEPTSAALMIVGIIGVVGYSIRQRASNQPALPGV